MSRAPAVAQLEPLTARLGHRFRDPQLLERALTHRSFAGEHRLPPAATNERLEFLGDAVIELVVSHLLVAADPEASEGELSRRRSRLVCREALAAAAAELGLGEHLRLGAGERRAGGAAKGSILAAAYEALVGALYLDAGLEAARARVERDLGGRLGEAAAQAAGDPKGRLQELTQGRFRLRPRYEVVAATGPDHDRRFRVAVHLGARRLAEGEGRSKKQAEQAAARAALEALAAEGEAEAAG